MFNWEAKLFKEKKNNTITTKKICIRFLKAFFLENKKSIINKRKKQNKNKWKEVLSSFLKNMKDRSDIEYR